MKSAASFSNQRLFYPTLWKKNMTRFWPIWTVYFVCWLLAMPLTLLMMSSDAGYTDSMPDIQRFADVSVLRTIPEGSVVAAFIFAILSAMAVFSYLYNNRSVGFFHALPVRRGGLFLTNYLSGLSFMLLPTGAIYLLTILAELATGSVNLGALTMWLAMQVLLSVFFYSFAVFCAMFTGHILALPAFYGILSVLPVALVQLINGVLESFVFGFRHIAGLNELSLWLSPIVQLFDKLDVERLYHTEARGTEIINVLDGAVFHGLGYGLVYAFAGIVLGGLAMLLYRKRHLEGAGDVVTVSWVRPIFKYGVAFCSALALGLMLYSFFAYSLPEGAWTLLCFMIFSGAVGYFVAEMLLKKSFRIFGGSWKGCVILSLCLIALVAGMELDVTGFERRVPAAGQVDSVSFSGPDSAPQDTAGWMSLETEDPELIQAILQIHQQVVEERAFHEANEYFGSYEMLPADGPLAYGDTGQLEVQTMGTTTINVEYHMAGGGTAIRQYNVSITAEALQDSNSVAGRLSALINRPEILLDRYFPEREEPLRLSNISIDLFDTTMGQYITCPVPAEYREELIAAMKRDIEAGRLGQRYLLEDVERLTNCSYSDLELEHEYIETSADGCRFRTRITPQMTATETLACLREAGVLTDTRLLETQLQRAIREESGKAEYWGEYSATTEVFVG